MTAVARRLNTVASTPRPTTTTAAATTAAAKPPRTLRAAEGELRMAQVQLWMAESHATMLMMQATIKPGSVSSTDLANAQRALTEAKQKVDGLQAEVDRLRGQQGISTFDPRPRYGRY